MIDAGAPKPTSSSHEKGASAVDVVEPSSQGRMAVIVDEDVPCNALLP